MRAAVDVTQVVQAAGLIFSGSLAGELFRWLLKRRDDKDKEPADLMRAMSEFSESLSDGGKELVNEFRREFVYLREEINRLTNEAETAKQDATLARQENAQVRASLEAQGADHRKCENELAELKLEVAALMSSSRVAHWGEKAPPE